MAQWRTDTQEYKKPHNVTLFETFMQANEYGYIESEGASARSAFGERLSVPITPVIQLDAIYGFDPRHVQTLTYSASGVAISENGMFKVSAGSDSNSYGVIRSTNFLRYRPGQGALARFTASYSANPVGFTQRAGLFNQEQALMVGYDSDNGRFGILRANGGKAYIHRFVFTTLGAGNVTVTLNGVAFTAVTVAGATVASNIAQLAAGLKLQALFNALYIVEYNATEIRFISTSLGAQVGAMTVTSTGTLSYTSQMLQAGVAQTNNWVYQENWNLDKLDGTGTSGITLDPSKLNVFQINFRWLGAGEMRFAIENPLNGDMIFFHHEHYSNQNTVPHLGNPSLKLGYVAANLGAVAGSVTCRGASMLGAVEGIVVNTRLPHSRSATRTAGLNTPGSRYHMISILGTTVFTGKVNTRDTILKRLTGAVNTTGDPAIVEVWYNPTLTNPLLWTDGDSYDASLYAVADTTGEFTLPVQTGIPLATYYISNGDTLNADLQDLFFRMPPGNFMTITIRSTSNITNASISLIYIED